MRRTRVSACVPAGLTAGALVLAALHVVLAAPAAPQEELDMPARLRAEMTIVNAEEDPRTRAGKRAVGEVLGMPRPSRTTPWVQFPTGTAMLSITIQRWSLEEEQDALRAANDSGGLAGMMKAMKKLPALGDVHVGGERVTIRAAATWVTERVQRIQLVFNSRLVTTNPDAFAATGRALDILDLTLPHGQQYGSGSLVTATKVEFAERGLISPVTFAIDSATQPISQVERQPGTR